VEGGLYRPADFKPGRRYPLVIQTHGFAEHEFSTAGFATTAMRHARSPALEFWCCK